MVCPAAMVFFGKINRPGLLSFRQSTWKVYVPTGITGPELKLGVPSVETFGAPAATIDELIGQLAVCPDTRITFMMPSMVPFCTEAGVATGLGLATASGAA